MAVGTVFLLLLEPLAVGLSLPLWCLQHVTHKTPAGSFSRRPNVHVDAVHQDMMGHIWILAFLPFSTQSAGHCPPDIRECPVHHRAAPCNLGRSQDLGDVVLTCPSWKKLHLLLIHVLALLLMISQGTVSAPLHALLCLLPPAS